MNFDDRSVSPRTERENPMLEVKIKADRYGQAIALLLQLGEGFQTRFERTLIVNSEQKRVLEGAGLVAGNGTAMKTRKGRGEKAK
jgi:hypothetical protein